MTDDDDRIFLVNTQWLRENVRLGEMPPITTELKPTDDPNKFVFQVTAPMPKIYIKRANGHGYKEIN
jgi:hypothetical protein